MIFFLLWSLTGMLTYDTRVLLVMLFCSLVIFKVSHTEWKQVGTVFQFILLFLCINMLAVWLFSPNQGTVIYGTKQSFYTCLAIIISQRNSCFTSLILC